MDNIFYLNQTVYAAYAPHKKVIDDAVHTAAMNAASKIGAGGFAAAFSKLQLIAAKQAA